MLGGALPTLSTFIIGIPVPGCQCLMTTCARGKAPGAEAFALTRGAAHACQLAAIGDAPPAGLAHTLPPRCSMKTFPANQPLFPGEPSAAPTLPGLTAPSSFFPSRVHAIVCSIHPSSGSLRAKYNIAGNCFADCMVAFWCPACQLCQETREVRLQQQKNQPPPGFGAPTTVVIMQSPGGGAVPGVAAAGVPVSPPPPYPASFGSAAPQPQTSFGSPAPQQQTMEYGDAFPKPSYG